MFALVALMMARDLSTQTNSLRYLAYRVAVLRRQQNCSGREPVPDEPAVIPFLESSRRSSVLRARMRGRPADPVRAMAGEDYEGPQTMLKGTRVFDTWDDS